MIIFSKAIVSNQSMANWFSKRRWCQCIALQFILPELLFNHQTSNLLPWAEDRPVRRIVECRVAVVVWHQWWFIRFVSHYQGTSIWLSASMRSSKTFDVLLHLVHITFYVLNLLIHFVNTLLRRLSLLRNCSRLEKVWRSIGCSRDLWSSCWTCPQMQRLSVESSVHTRCLGCGDSLPRDCTLMNSNLGHYRRCVGDFILSLGW